MVIWRLYQHSGECRQMVVSPVSESIAFAWFSVKGLTKPVMKRAREAASLEGGARLGVLASCRCSHEMRCCILS